MMTHRPTTGSFRSSVMLLPPVAGGSRWRPPAGRLLDLFLLGDGLAVDALGGDRPGDQPLLLDLPAAPVADPERAALDPLDGLPDLGHELAVPVPQTEGEVPVRLERGPVGRVGEVLLLDVGHVDDRPLRSRQQFIQLTLEFGPAFFDDNVVHRSQPPGYSPRPDTVSRFPGGVKAGRRVWRLAALDAQLRPEGEVEFRRGEP